MIYREEQWQATDGSAVSIKVYRGASTESKPTDVPYGSQFYEWDTSKTYIFTGAAWIEEAT